MSMDIFKGTPQHEYYLELAREEVQQAHLQAREGERQLRLQAQRNILLVIVQARFPKLVNFAKVQTREIKDILIMDEVLGRVGAAQTTVEAANALLSWLPDDDLEE